MTENYAKMSGKKATMDCTKKMCVSCRLDGGFVIVVRRRYYDNTWLNAIIYFNIIETNMKKAGILLNHYDSRITVQDILMTKRQKK